MLEHQNIVVSYTCWGHIVNCPNHLHSIATGTTDQGPYSNYSLEAVVIAIITIAIDHMAAADRIVVEIGPHNCIKLIGSLYC